MPTSLVTQLFFCHVVGDLFLRNPGTTKAGVCVSPGGITLRWQDGTVDAVPHLAGGQIVQATNHYDNGLTIDSTTQTWCVVAYPGCAGVPRLWLIKQSDIPTLDALIGGHWGIIRRVLGEKIILERQ